MLLDVGCASGNQDSALLPCRIIALDEDPAVFIGHPPKSFKYHQLVGRGEELPLANQCVDYVLCHHVLEHATAAERMLREIARVLKPSGALSIAVPNGHGLCDGLYRYLFEGGGHVNRFKQQELVRMVEAVTGLRLARWRKLYSSFVYISRSLTLLAAPPPGLPKRLTRLGRLPRGAVEFLHEALYLGTRYLDRQFDTSLAVYGWAMYFERTRAVPEELPAMINVCRHCGAGHPAAAFIRYSRHRCQCPGCYEKTLFFEPFGNTF